MRVLLAAFKQETSSFNPRATTRDLFTITRGNEIIEHYAGTNSEIAGALDVFAENNVEVIPTYSAKSMTSGGPVPAVDLDQMTDELEQRLADIGYLEVPFGTGEVDMVGSMRALKQIRYQGTVYPEHYPAIAGDSAAGLAWTIGYMRALDQAVQI